MTERHRLLRREQRLLMRQLRLTARAPQPLVQDEGDEQSLSTIQDGAERWNGAPRARQRVDEHRGVEVDQERRRLG